MQKITPMLWFDNQAEEAARFYTSIFDGDPKKSERVMAALMKMTKLDIETLERAAQG